MNDTPSSNKFDFSKVLAAGMIIHSGLVGQAMANVAQRQRGSLGWEAFHYERLSDSTFEITGGFTDVSSGIKKWPEPHDALIISEQEIEAELMHLLAPSNTAQLPLQMGRNEHPPLVTNHEKVSPTYLHIVFALPNDEQGQHRLMKAFHLQADFFGATVETCQLSQEKYLKL